MTTMNELIGQSTMVVGGMTVPVVTARTAVVGTGAAGYCAAARLIGFGCDDVVMVTDRVRAGTSRNAGSDKQTYYKLTLGGDEPDSVRAMAETLFSGGAMDGDLALAEAAWSPRAFFHLVDAGVPFPCTEMGEFVGYKTDHDPRQRATSVGPYTSKTMVERLERRVLDAGVRVLDGCRVVDLLVADGAVVGLLCLRRDVHADDLSDDERGELQETGAGVGAVEGSGATVSPPGASSGATECGAQAGAAVGGSPFLLIRCADLVYATGGPAGMYADAVYPHGQWGAQGAALRAGAVGRNLTEWQFGLASVRPRWNVSGSYMQVMPRFVSTDADGGDEREFLSDRIPDLGRLMTLIFLKGYQWPFDVRKAKEGSSVIDLLVYEECVLKGRRVFLDFTRNPAPAAEDGETPAEEPFDADILGSEARDYLEAAGVLALGDSTPLERLRALNEPAYRFYLERNPGIDLAHEWLEVAVCAQHNNGGLAVDSWWRSNLAGFFPIGEAAGTHGVYRPGGAALNAGQVGATRAATHIARHPHDLVADDVFASTAAPVVGEAHRLLARSEARHAAGEKETVSTRLDEVRRRLTRDAGVVRSSESVAAALQATIVDLETDVAVDPSSRRSVDRLFLLRDIVSSQRVYLAAMADYLERGGRSRGSVLYTDPEGSLPALAKDLPDLFRFLADDGALDGFIQEIAWDGRGEPVVTWRDVRPIPDEAPAFETVWRQYRGEGE
ncbi:MAG: FAD-binding protein [Propionibacteriaceae bacterium]|nr:FAD-binding protein [Propionibacteriaceae bacterium]